MKWLKHILLIQCRNSVFFFDPDTSSIRQFQNIGHIIYRILFIISCFEFICETIEGYIIYVSFKKNKCEKIAKLTHGKITFFQRIKYNYEKKALSKIRTIKKDRSKNYDIVINHDYTHSYININGKTITFYGHVEGYALLQEECYFLISNFNQPGCLYKIDDLINRSSVFDLTFQHKFINGIPIYDNDIDSDDLLFFIHGGPESNYMNFYDHIISEINKLNIYRIILINYVGSTGYSQKYQEKIYKNGGKVDLESILTVLNNYKGNKIIIGESYGGYLSVLLSLKSSFDIKIDKVIALNGFTDIYFQLFFSKASNIIQKYFCVNNEDKIKKVNPISLVENRNYPICKITFIHSIDDVVCPIKQIYYFNELLYQCTKERCRILLIKGSHQQLNLNERKKISDIIIKELRRDSDDIPN